MNTSTFIGLLNNVALLIALAVLFDAIVLDPRFEKAIIKLFTGIVFGILGAAVMLTPWEFIPGVFFDTRSVVLSVGGLFFGTIPTIVAVLITGLLRYLQGGVGTWTGIAVIITSAVFGIIWRHKRLKIRDNLGTLELYSFGIIVHIAMLLWMLTLPSKIARSLLSNISLPVMILYPLVTVLIGKLLVARIKRKKEKELLNLITMTSPAGISVVTTTGLIVFANNRAEELLGLKKDQITQLAYNAPEWRITDFNGCPFPEEQLPFRQVIATQNPVYNVQHAIEWPNGRRVLLNINAAPTFNKTGQLEGMVATFEDITERKQAEEQLNKSLKEKETLLQEIHHRVKNNMQVISSLLNLQSNNIENKQIKETLRESQSRVHTMAAVHESLHDSDSLSEINLQAYLSKVTSAIFQTYSIEPDKIGLINEVEPLPININQSYPLGLIINESVDLL